MEERFKARINLPTQCRDNVNWLASSQGENKDLALKADSCYILNQAGWIDHIQYTKCMLYSGDGNDFETRAH